MQNLVVEVDAPYLFSLFIISRKLCLCRLLAWVRALPIDLAFFKLLNVHIHRCVLMFQFNNFLSHFMCCSVFVFHVSFDLPIGLACHGGFLHAFFHLINHVDHLQVVLVFLLQSAGQVIVHLLHLSDHFVSFGKFLLDSVELLRISKCVFRANNILQLRPQSCALVNVSLDLDLNFLKLSAFNVTHESLDLFLHLLVLNVHVSYLSFQVDNQMSFYLDVTYPDPAGPASVQTRHAIVACVLIHSHIIDNFILTRDLSLKNLNACTKSCILRR